MEKISHTCHSPEETQAFAALLGSLLEGGEFLALQGELGAGKTCFVKGLAQGLEVPPEVYVRSPTFALLDEYPGRFPLFHLDLYRLEDEDELEAIGWRDCFDGRSVVAVEWADRIPEAHPDDKITIVFHLHQGDTRILELHFSPAHLELAQKLRDALK